MRRISNLLPVSFAMLWWCELCWNAARIRGVNKGRTEGGWGSARCSKCPSRPPDHRGRTSGEFRERGRLALSDLTWVAKHACPFHLRAIWTNQKPAWNIVRWRHWKKCKRLYFDSIFRILENAYFLVLNGTFQSIALEPQTTFHTN